MIPGLQVGGVDTQRPPWPIGKGRGGGPKAGDGNHEPQSHYAAMRSEPKGTGCGRGPRGKGLGKQKKVHRISTAVETSFLEL
ncbi:hypothetical protein EYF80_043391 [Liparis tanakae]|uniref:Uncharacterized protein n=1 Tax=Liparis tanakae TaxID=230148 RepID=A0A4Z2G001_9TELE|nr:hypothetical protein EYF80_043391 [Liparis tanakae]